MTNFEGMYISMIAGQIRKWEIPNPKKVSTAEMINYTIQALWSYGYMKMTFSGYVK